MDMILIVMCMDTILNYFKTLLVHVGPISGAYAAKYFCTIQSILNNTHFYKKKFFSIMKCLIPSYCYIHIFFLPSSAFDFVLFAILAPTRSLILLLSYFYY